MAACSKCGGPLPSQMGRGARRKSCEKCAPSRNRGRLKAPVAVVTDFPGGVLKATRATLEAAGRFDTPAGQAALVLAAKLDAANDTASGLASAARQLTDCVASALEGVKTEASSLDELRLRRDKKSIG